MKNLKIKTKLTAAFATIIAILILSMGVAIISMQNLSSKVNYYSSSAIPVVNSMWTGRRAMVATERALYKAMSDENLEETKANIEDAQAQLDALKEVVSVIQDKYEGDPQDIEQYNMLMNSTTEVKEKIYKLLEENHNEEALKLIREEYTPTFVEAAKILTTMATNVQERIDQYSVNAKRSAMITMILLIALVVAGTVAAIAVCRMIIKSIRVPIEEIQSAAKELAQGNLEARINYEGQDELGELAGDLKMLVSTFVAIIQDLGYGLKEIGNGDFTVASKVQDLYIGDYKTLETSMYALMSNLSKTLRNINEASNNVAGNAEQISQGAQSITEGATDQASSIEELQATVTEILVEVDRNAKNSQDADELAKEVGQNIGESNQQMKRMVKAMDVITESSKQIENIINTIDDIADQTNLLALNASIEAARAGLAGSGFAVVATEVGNLAAQSAAAAKNSNELIANAISAVEDGKHIVDETAVKLEASAEKTNELVGNIGGISQASARQAHALDQIAKAVEQIASVVEENSAMAEESSASSEELAEQSQVLKSLVGKFKTLEE